MKYIEWIKNHFVSPKLNFLSDKRGISPVVGVLMLLAITVVMAGYLGSEVLSFEFEKPAPPVSISAQYEKTDNGSVQYGTVRLQHIGGATLNASDIKILANGSEVNLSYWKKDSWGIGESVILANIGNQPAALDYPVSKSTKKPSAHLLSAGEEIEITVVNVSHNQILYKTTVRCY
ncbi:type IV pilin N-terminal domain-containing protein [Methanolapillus ohkumae]|uniref:Archaeal Type IV pilin N-terminal domain-containing protein n=1 Tax=Methanolapillus ohkumae TaxID=3028298 RepID=A0AA97A682_9EURY|nr:hypothetical protein MsAm2_08860 [Methanosarcinaceae archaeon Am2]